MLYSLNDEYEENGNCLLYDVFENTKLQYVHVYNDKFNSNVANSIVISKNTENLRYMNVFIENSKYNFGSQPVHGNGAYEIKLDVSTTVPKDLRVYAVDT